jgi:hypothetical protein
MAFTLEFGVSASVIDGERLKKYVFYKLRTELPVGPFCILYMHSTVQSDDNNPGMSILRTIYEELPPEYKERLQVFYFLHPGLRSRLAIATLGRLFLSGGSVFFHLVLRHHCYISWQLRKLFLHCKQNKDATYLHSPLCTQ